MRVWRPPARFGVQHDTRRDGDLLEAILALPPDRRQALLAAAND
jgi:hypothetical protein